MIIHSHQPTEMPSAESARVYVGGVPPDASAAELQERFSRALTGVASSCRVTSVELPPPKGVLAPAPRGFAYLALVGGDAAAGAQLLARTFHRTKWRGSVLRVEPARLDFPAQLRAEWEQQRVVVAAAAEARTLALAPPPSAWPTDAQLRDLRVGGVTFSGRRRTSFREVGEWAEEETHVVTVMTKATAVATTATAADRSDEEQEEEGDDADYWATSGDEAGGDDDDSDDDSDNDKDKDKDSADDQDKDSAELSLDEDDVEAFVAQALAQQQQETTTASRDERARGRQGSDSAVVAERGGDVKEDEEEKALVAQTQRDEANARRVAALAAKAELKQQQQQQPPVKIDLTLKRNTKITFDDSGNEQEAGESEPEATAITNWLDSSDDDDDDERKTDYGELRDGSDAEAESDRTTARRRVGGSVAFEFDDGGDDDNDGDAGKAFAVRPEFLGERGRKLFELQKRFGGDQRFRMDARFIDDEENEYGGMNDLVGDDDDDIDTTDVADGPAGELQTFLQEDGADTAAAQEYAWLAEQDAALSAIAAIFPDVDVESIKYRVRVKATKDPIKEAAWMGRLQRYDPRDAHARLAYELSTATGRRTTSQADNADAEEPNVTTEKKSRDEKKVLIGGDRFFSTSTSLGSLFTRVRKNSEDGVEGEAALDGVFSSARGPDADADADAGGAATFKLSSLFDAPVDDDKGEATNARLAAMGATLFDDDENDENDKDAGDKPWHFTQSFLSDEKDGDDVRMDTDNEDDGDDNDSGGDGDGDDGDDATSDSKTKRKQVVKKSVSEFLAFGRAFVQSSQDIGGSSKLQATKEWTEKRKRLTLDYKRKRKDALRNKKKLQQRLQKQHKKQKTTR